MEQTSNMGNLRIVGNEDLRVKSVKLLLVRIQNILPIDDGNLGEKHVKGEGL